VQDGAVRASVLKDRDIVQASFRGVEGRSNSKWVSFVLFYTAQDLRIISKKVGGITRIQGVKGSGIRVKYLRMIENQESGKGPISHVSRFRKTSENPFFQNDQGTC